MARHAVNLANGKTDEQGIFRLLGRLFNQSGVIEATALTVTAQPTPDMTVRVSGSAANDNAIFLTTAGACYHGWNTASENVTIQANSSGVTKTDTLVAYIDTAAGSATANNPNGLVFLAVRRGGVDIGAPTDAEIDTATGSKPWIKLANIVVGSGVTSINSGNITDARRFAGIGNGLVTNTSLAPSAITLGYQEVATSQGSITTEVDLTGLSVTVTVPTGGRRIRITAHLGVISSVAGDRVTTHIKEGTTYLSRSIRYIGVASAEEGVEFSSSIVPTAGTHTYKLSMLRETGSGTVSATAFANNPAFILVEAV